MINERLRLHSDVNALFISSMYGRSVVLTGMGDATGQLFVTSENSSQSTTPELFHRLFSEEGHSFPKKSSCVIYLNNSMMAELQAYGPQVWFESPSDTTCLCANSGAPIQH
jgi:hypothetical protein